MSNGSIVVLVAVGALMALAVWRNIRKGAPCSCGHCGACRSGCRCGSGESASCGE